MDKIVRRLRCLVLLTFIPFVLQATAYNIHLKHELFEVTYSVKGIGFSPANSNLSWTWQIAGIDGLKIPANPNAYPEQHGNDIIYNRGSITEKYLFRGNNIEQQFIIEGREHITGDLLIKGEVNSNGAFSETEGGWLWKMGSSSVFLGNVYAFDADNKQVSAHMKVSNGTSSIYIPYQELIHAKYPVTIDPQIGPDDFILANNGIRLYQPRLIYNSAATPKTFFSTWTQFSGYNQPRNEDIFGSHFYASHAQNAVTDITRPINNASFKISGEPSAGSQTNSSATASDVASSGANFLAVWEDFKGNSFTSVIIKSRLSGITNTESDTASLFNDATFVSGFGSASLPAVAGNNDKYLAICAAEKGIAPYHVVGKFIQSSGVAENTAYLPVFTSSAGSFVDTDMDAGSSGNFLIASATHYMVYYGWASGSGMLNSGSLSVPGKVGSVAVSAGQNSSFLLVWSELLVNNYIIKGYNGTNVFRIDPTDHNGSGKPSVAYNPDSNSWLVAWHTTPSAGPTSGTMIWGREIQADGTMNDAFPLSKQSRTSVSPAVAYDQENKEFWIAWSGGGNQDMLLAQRWTNSMADCIISVRQDTIRENNHLKGQLNPATDIFITTFYALTSKNDSLYPLNYYLTNTDTLGTSFLKSSLTTVKPSGSLNDIYVMRDKLFYTRNDSVNYEDKKAYNASVYAQSEIPGTSGRSPVQSKKIRVVDVNEPYHAIFPTSLTLLEDQMQNNFIPFTFHSGDLGKERNGLEVNVTQTPAFFTGAPALKVNPSVPGGGHDDIIPRTEVTKKDTLFFNLKPDANGQSNLTLSLKDLAGGEFQSLQKDNTGAVSISVTVTAVNDVPTFTPGPNITVLEDSGPFAFPHWASYISAGPMDEYGQVLTFAVTTANSALFSELPAIEASTGMLTFSTAPDMYGTSVVEVSLKDNGGTENGGVDTSPKISFTIEILPVNDAPVFVSGSNISVQEDSGAQTINAWATGIGAGPANEQEQLLQFSVSINDPSLFSTQPAIHPLTGALSFTPAPDANGMASVRVRLGDDGGTANGGRDSSDVITFYITIEEVNDPPVLSLIGNKTVDEQSLLTFMTDVTDPDLPGQNLTYSLDAVSQSLGMSISPTGVFSWTPSESQGGADYEVTITVTDDGINPSALSDSETITITVNEVNQAPLIAAIGNKLVIEKENLTFIVTASDQDIPAQTLVLSISGDGLAPGMNFDPATGLFSWTPTEEQGGYEYEITFIVTDNGTNPDNLTGSETILITVTDTNEPPVLAAIGNKSVNELETLIFTAVATDPDLPSQTLTFSIDPAAQSIGMSIDADTGVFSWTPSEDQGGAMYEVTIAVTDNGFNPPALSDYETISITVNEVNQPPVLEPIGDLTVNELATLSFSASAGDPDLPAQTLSFSIDQNAIALGMSITESGVFSWTPAEDQGGAIYQVTLTVTDNGTNPARLTDSETFNISVTEVNMPPSISAIGDQSVNEQETLAFTVTASDSDVPAQTLLFTIDAAARALGMEISGDGHFSWTPSEEQGGTDYPVTITVTDDGTNPAGLSDSETITITVREANSPPLLAAIGDKMAKVQTELTFTCTATDQDRPLQSLTFSIDENAQSKGMSMTPEGVFSFTPSEAQNSASFQVTITVTDNGTNPAQLSDSETITITVSSINSAPVLEPIGNKSVNEQELLTFICKATDTDLPAQNLRFTINSGARAIGMAISPGGVFTWKPSEAQGGRVSAVTITVTDDGTNPDNLSDSETIFITVHEVNVPPLLHPIGNQNVTEQETLSFTAKASDQDIPAQSLSFEINQEAKALGMSITPGGEFTWTPGHSHGGNQYQVTVTVTDNGVNPANLKDSETFTITVNDVNIAPEFISGNNVSSPEDSGPQVVAGWASGIVAGPPSESWQSLQFAVTSNNSGLFSEQPFIHATTGDLSYTPAPDAFGTAAIRVRLGDNGGTANGGVDSSKVVFFTIDISPVNDAPRILQSFHDIFVDEFSSFEFSADPENFADVDDDVLDISLAAETNNWIHQINDGKVYGLALPDSDTQTTLFIRVTDSQGLWAEDTITVTIIRKPRPLVYGYISDGTTEPGSYQVLVFNASPSAPDTLFRTYTRHGYFHFGEIPPGNYMIKAVSETATGDADIISTYYRSAADWHEATAAQIGTGDVYRFDITMLRNPGTQGPGSISGFAYDAGSVNGSQNRIPVPEVDIVLKGTGNNGIVLRTRTGLDGSYRFTGLPAGEYDVFAGIYGYNSTFAHRITISTQMSEFSNVNFLVYRNSLVITDISQSEHGSLLLYPNPTSGLLYFRTPTHGATFHIRVINFNGQVMKEQVFRTGMDNRLDLRRYTKGTYLIEMVTDGIKTVVPVILK